jgi:hypothetical protein
VAILQRSDAILIARIAINPAEIRARSLCTTGSDTCTAQGFLLPVAQACNIVDAALQQWKM